MLNVHTEMANVLKEKQLAELQMMEEILDGLGLGCADWIGRIRVPVNADLLLTPVFE